jgi:hypothetical protein
VIRRAFVWFLAAAVAGFAASVIPWEDLTEGDWLYAAATRFALVDGHRVHYPTPTAELARQLEAGQDAAALRQLAEAELALGDRKGALETLRRWAAAQGSRAWDETARWAAAHQEPAAALEAAERALPGLPEEERLALAEERIQWAQRHPELADPIAMMQARSTLVPGDGQALERWVRALEKAGRLEEAERALAGAQALDPERRLLLSADLRADHGDPKGAFRLLDGAVDRPWSLAFRKAYAARAGAAAPVAWRATLETRFDAPALVRLATWFQGRGQGDAAADLLRQVERRYGQGLGRPDNLLLARLYGEIDAVPEAFREALAAAHAGTPEQQTGDLASLARLALRAGGRPLAWGNYNDESYRWVASLDRTPGFWTGGVSFLLTGVAWKETLDRLEDGSMPDRTFATARALAGALAQRSPGDPELPGLRVAIMERHVERGEGQAALDLLPLVETTPLADEARRVALLAAQSAALPRAEELRLFKARLRHAAPDGSRSPVALAGYKDMLNGAVARLDALDPSHRAALDLCLTELDRMPDAEELWLGLAGRLEGWNLDDDLGPRYQRALDRFQGPGLWAKAARWYARRGYRLQLRQLGEEVAARFRGAALFQRAVAAGDLTVASPEQPGAGRVRMVLWADWVRLKALERFPHSPLVFREASRLVPESVWRQQGDPARGAAKVVVPDALVQDRRWAVLFADAGVREAWFAQAMRQHSLEAKLEALEAGPGRTPVEDLLLFEGWARLSRFERAAAPADRLAAAYPGDGALAQRALALHRSLNALESSHFEAARTLVARTAPALEDPAPLWTELGEMEEERGRPRQAVALWGNLLAGEPRDPAKVAELATLLWDYGHDPEALAVVEAGRKAMDRPRFYAFETGVLRENLRDLEGAVREYLDAARPEDPDVASAWYYQDPRSLRRLAQLLSRDRVFRMVAQRIQRLAPGNPEDERYLAAFFPLATLEPQDPRAWAEDQWIDFLDQPADPQGRAARAAAREDQRPAQAEAIRRMGDLLLDKVRDMVPQATSQKLLDFAAGQDDFIRGRWSGERMVAFKDLVLARRAQLAPSEEERAGLEIQRARFLAANGRMAEADAVWAGLGPILERLPEGTARIKAEAQRADYLERGRGIPAAAQAWRRLTARYPWSLGLLEDRLGFLARTGLGEEGRDVLEQAAARAGAGYREDLLQRLAQASLEAGDLPRARRAAEQLLGLDGLGDQDRLRAAHVMARLSFRADPGWDALALARLQEPRLQPERRPELYHELARAADLEQAPALGLWIETLNRRAEKAWLLEAARSVAGAGKGPELLAFFQRQRERSPRDVRWAVAVRDLRRAFHDVPGAIEAAKAAVKVRPDQESLWHEAADILVRADRIREAADFMEGWNRPRPADEGVARFRAELYERAGDPAKALAVEQGALAAFAREAPDRPGDLAERRARAADRLMGLGHADLALRLLSPRGDVADLADTRLSWRDQAGLALLTGQFPRLVETRSDDAEFLAAAGAVLAERGRPEAREAVQSRLAQALFPAGGRPDSAALDRWWPFIGASGLEPGLRAALGQRLLESRPGPWQMAPPFVLAQQAGIELIHAQSSGAVAFREPDLPGLWCRELAREERGEDLLVFMEPRWRELMRRTRDTDPLSARTETLPWASWLQDPAVLKVFVRAAAARPGMAAELAEVMGSRPLWDRFWALAARRWEPRPLVAALPAQTRAAWFRFWEPQSQDPVLQARRRTVEQVGLALGRLLQGAPGAAEDPLVARLRGPRTVGGVLGADAQWTWPDFNPRPADQGDDLVLGQGADRGRLPGALWGERPGPAWYVLEALARYRQGDAAAPRLPLVSPEKGGETQRAILAVRLARAMKDLPLALELAADGPDRDLPWLEAKLALLAAAGRRQEAAGALKASVRAGQATLTQAGFQNFAGLAGGLGLPGPMACLDPERPVGPAFLAYLQDLAPGDAARFRTEDEMSFRAALAERWRGREARLTPAQLRTWLRELWAGGAAGLPQSHLASLGPVWPYAVPWLQAQDPPERPAALQALAQALDPAVAQPPLLARLTVPGSPYSWHLLALRLRLARGETAQAVALVDGTLAGLRRGDHLSWEAAPEVDEDRSWDPLVARLQDWLLPFRDGGRVQVEERFRAFLAERRHQGPVSAPEWQLALSLRPGAQAPDLLREMEEAWFRGELEPYRLPDLLPALAAAAPTAAPGWLARCPGDLSWAGTRRRAEVLAALKQPAQAGRTLAEARRRALWTSEEEGLAFQFWRQRKFPVPAPGYWQGALAVWNSTQDLGARLQGHPQDILSARSALETLAPLDPDSARRAALALGQDQAYQDRTILDVRAARAARTAGPADPHFLARLLPERGFPAAAIDAALTDLARAAARSGDVPGARAFLDVLAERGEASLDPRERMRSRGGLEALAAELPPPARTDPFKLVDGRLTAIRPRDLTWAMLADVLKLEGAP